jgi:hypothetical protein
MLWMFSARMLISADVCFVSETVTSSLGTTVVCGSTQLVKMPDNAAQIKVATSRTLFNKIFILVYLY